MKSNKESLFKKIKNKCSTIRMKLFITLCVTITIIIAVLVIINSGVLETYYIYSKQSELMNTYKVINSYYNGNETTEATIEIELEKMSFSNNFEILIKTDTNIYTSNKDFLSSLADENFDVNGKTIRDNTLYSSDNVTIERTVDNQTRTFIYTSFCDIG